MIVISGCSADAPPPATAQNTTLHPLPAMPSFGSDALALLLQQAQQNNTDVAMAQARVAQAIASERTLRGTLFPSVSLTGQLGHAVQNNATATTFDKAGFLASYQLDLFGQNRATRAAAQAQTRASMYDVRNMHITIATQVMQQYVLAQALHARLTIARDNIAAMERILLVLQKRYRAGTASQLEVAQQHTLLSSSKANIALLEQQYAVAKNSLALLVGQKTDDFTLPTQELTQLKPLPVPTQIAATQFMQRPDIASAQEQLHAANFRIDSAQAALLPSITLNFDGSLAQKTLSAPITVLSTLLGSIEAPIFNRNALEGNLDQARAKAQEAAAQYRKAVLNAYADVANTLNACRQQDIYTMQIKTAADSAAKAYALSNARFKQGSIDSVALLDAQRTLLQTQDALAQAFANQLLAQVDLLRAMGRKADYQN